VVSVLGSETYRLTSKELDTLTNGIFRVMLAGVGIGCVLSLSRLRWEVFNV